MEKIISLILLLVGVLTCNGSDTSFDSIVIGMHIEKPDHNVKEDPGKPIIIRHSPSAPITCILSQNEGVQMMAAEKPVIYYYQIEDECDNVLIYPDEASFVEALFNMNGYVKITLVSEYLNYVGETQL